MKLTPLQANDFCYTLNPQTPHLLTILNPARQILAQFIAGKGAVGLTGLVAPPRKGLTALIRLLISLLCCGAFSERRWPPRSGSWSRLAVSSVSLVLLLRCGASVEKQCEGCKVFWVKGETYWVLAALGVPGCLESSMRILERV